VSLHIITGSMYGGKTKEGMKEILACTARPSVWHHGNDVTRRGVQNAGVWVTHDGLTYPSTAAVDTTDISVYLARSVHRLHLFVDEVQFFDASAMHALCSTWKKMVDITLVGLTYRADGERFATMAALLPLADRVTELRGSCTICGAPAERSQWLGPAEEPASDWNRGRVGGVGLYEPRCLAHWTPR
jgi:thymidine kinase